MNLTEEHNKNKRAIYFALLNYLDPYDASNASKIWLDDFSDKPVFELQSFITRISDDFDVDVSRKDLQQSIIKMLLSDDSELPNAEIPKSAFSYNNKNKKLQPSHVVFSLLIKQWLNEVSKINPATAGNIRQYIYDSLASVNMHFDEVINIKRWLNTKDNDVYIAHLTVEQLKQIFHFCYVASCQFLGPIQTDKLVSDTVKIVEQSTEATEFSPKNFF